MSAVVEFISDAVETVVDAVGDVVEEVGDFISDAVETVGDVVQAVIDDPLPVLLSVAGSFVGIPPMVTSAAITAARGGDLEDIVLSAGTAYFAPTATNAISSTLSSTIGDVIINETVSNVVVDGISKGLVNGVVSEVRGGDFDDGFAGAFTGTVVGAGVGEVSDFVSEEVFADLPDMGQFGNIAEKALTSGITAELTGRGDFDVAFTNSMINGTANLGANYITSSINDQFNATATTEFEIVGSEEGNEEDRSILLAELDESWAETSGTMGTGAGIPDEIVDQVQVSDIGQETPNNQEDPLMVESMSEDALSTDLAGYSSPTDYLETEAEMIAPSEDVSDLAAQYGDVYADEQPEAEDLSLAELDEIDEAYAQPEIDKVAQSAVAPEEIGVLSQYGVPEQPSVEAQEYDVVPEEAPVYAQKPMGGLGAVAQSPDVLESVTDSLIQPKTEETVIDVAGKEEPAIGMKGAPLGGLAAGLMPKGGTPAIVSGALNQILKPALRQGLTKAMRGAPARPVAKKPAPRPAPTRMTPAQLAAARQVRPAPATAPVAPRQTQARVAPPKKKDVATLTPVTNIAGLTSLLKSKG